MLARDPEDRAGRRSPGAASDPESAPARSAATDPNAWAADLELVAAAAQREPEALERFIARMRCVPRFLGCLNRRASRPLPPETIEDLVQDVLAVVWRRLAEFRGDAALETWVFRICDFQLRNALRRAAPRQGPSLEDVAEPEVTTPESPFDHEQLHLALEALEEAESRVLRLKHYGGLTFDEIATQLGQSANTIKSRYYRGLESLRRWLKRAGGER